MVAGLVFLITGFIYRTTEMSHWANRWLSLALILQTGIVIASAVKRLILYIDVYGLTLSRWWAMEIILFIGLILGIMLFGALLYKSSQTIFKLIFLSTLFVFSASLLYNTEDTVVRYNTQRFLAGGHADLDSNYLQTLSSDAVPALVDWAHADFPDPATNNNYGYGNNGTDARSVLKGYLMHELDMRKQSLEVLTSEDWRSLSWSDYRALNAIR